MAEASALPRPSTRAPALLVLMVASGFAGLGYQIVWTQQAALWLGHEAAAVFAVVSAFFGGLALGAFTLGRRIDRSPRPARWYAGCEVVIAAWSLVLAFAMAPMSDALLGLIGLEPTPMWQATVAFVGCFLLLLPATAAMGATLPAMERVLAALALPLPSSARSTTGMDATAATAPSSSPIAALYASNTLGAVLGVLLTAFWLVPAFGMMRTAVGCALLNLACAGIALVLARGADGMGAGAVARAGAEGAVPPTPSMSSMSLPSASASPKATSAQATPRVASRIWPLLAATGFLGIGYEVLVVRVLAQVSENTVYTFAILLAIYLLGTALGAAAYARWAPAQGVALAQSDTASRQKWVAVVAWACLAGTGSLWWAESVRDSALGWGAAGMGWALASEALPALLAFLLPTMAMGALFSHLATQARKEGRSLGLVLGANTLGAAAAPPVVAWLLVPVLGSKGALLLMCAGYLLLIDPQAWRRPGLAGTSLAGAGVAIAITAWLAPPLAFVTVPEGGRVLSYREGALAAVSVIEDADGISRLHINNRQQEGSSATLLADARQALLPLLLHPAPQRVLFLGLGTGVTAWAAAADPRLQVDAAELLPEVIEASALFRDAGAAPSAAGLATTEPRLVAADARRFVKAGGPDYQLIVSDNFHPARSGSGLLYTVEHFSAVRDRLASGGLFCQWLPLHQIDLETLRSVVQSFLAVYPEGAAVLATNSLQTPVLGLLGSARTAAQTAAEAPLFSLQAVRARIAAYGADSGASGANAGKGPQRLQDYGLGDAFAVLGSLVADAAALRRFAANAPLNTDDRPLVAYRAPRITYAPDSQPADRLQALLAELGKTPARPAALVDAGSQATAAAWHARLAAYWLARERFIAAGRAVRPSADARQMLAQVQAPLLAVLQTSPDFRPAFDPLQRMAAQLARSDPAAAQALLEALAAVETRRQAAEIPGALPTP